MISGTTKIYGIFGHPVRHTFSPAMQNAAFRKLGMDACYVPFAVPPERLKSAVQSVISLGLRGVNITVPHKERVIPGLDDLSEEARLIGAVNTIEVREGRLIGHNTDGSGWRWGFERTLPGADLARVVLLGAGGAGSAIAHVLLRMNTASLCIVDVDPARARTLAAALNLVYPGARAAAETDVARALQGASGLVHATPTGMSKLPGLPLSEGLLHPGLWVAEIVYFPFETALLQAARARGCRTVDGGAMAVGQAIGAFRLFFTGLEADAARVAAHFRRLIGATT